MPEYKAKPGQEDRHGEMTGAISINMALCGLPVTAWAIFLGPLVFESVWWVAGTSVLLAVVLALIGIPISRWIWARMSHWMEG